MAAESKRNVLSMVDKLQIVKIEKSHVDNQVDKIEIPTVRH